VSKGFGYYSFRITWMTEVDGGRRTRLQYGKNDEAAAWANYHALCAVPSTYWVMLIGPNGATTLANYEREPYVFPPVEEEAW
jgi:hypothetical protein